MLTTTVLVRRVVEARRLAAGEGAVSPQPYRTAALPPPNANEASHTPNEKGNGEPKDSWWRRLKCW
jgi:GTPase KRas protein